MGQRNRTTAIVGVAVLLWAIVTPFMWRDLWRRPPEMVRGKKWMWWVASSNLSGSIAYFVAGRTRAPASRAPAAQRDGVPPSPSP